MKQFFEAKDVSQFILRGVYTVAVLCIPAQIAMAVTCNVVKHNPPSEADKAMLAGDYAKAESLYQGDLAKQPADPDFTAGLVHALLREQKLPEAVEAVQTALTASPKSAVFITLRGEVELRQGEPWLVEPTVVESYKIDPCNPRTRLLFAKVLETTFRYATARQQISLAHQFDPADPEIRLAWIKTLSLQQRAKELEDYLAAPSGDDAETVKQLHAELDRMQRQVDEPVKACRLVSASPSGEVPFIRLAGWNGHSRAYGLEVGMNGHPIRLQIDTRGAGLTVYRAAADRAGLKRLGSDKGSAAAPGAKPSYTAYADSVHIGNLEFQDCAVNVIDSASPDDDGDGQVGIDIFSDFMVTLDFPMRKVVLAALPVRPGETELVPSLKTVAADMNDLAPVVAGVKPADAKAGASASAPAAAGPFDRYTAPEMKDYTQIYHVGHDLILPTALNGEKVKLFVPDAATSATNLSPGVVMDAGKFHEDKSMEHPGPDGKAARVFVADEVSFNFAHVAQKLNGVVSSDTSWASKADGMEISGFLGMNTLSLLTLHIDYRDGLLKAEYVPGRGYKFE
jgi:predicted aspartyl protease